MSARKKECDHVRCSPFGFDKQSHVIEIVNVWRHNQLSLLSLNSQSTCFGSNVTTQGLSSSYVLIAQDKYAYKPRSQGLTSSYPLEPLMLQGCSREREDERPWEQCCCGQWLIGAFTSTNHCSTSNQQFFSVKIQDGGQSPPLFW